MAPTLISRHLASLHPVHYRNFSFTHNDTSQDLSKADQTSSTLACIFKIRRMSEPIPESIPTSADPKSKRPTKRRALTPSSQHANQVTALFAKSDRDIVIPDTTDTYSKRPNLPPPPEIVANVQGSSAGAGSGEFHVYKASRRREYERLRMMDEEVVQEKAKAEFDTKQTEWQKRDEERTSKNRKKREKLKMRKERKDQVGPKATALDGNRLIETKSDSSLEADHSAMDSKATVSEVERQGIIIHDDD